mgnify:CR=1 FL=1
MVHISLCKKSDYKTLIQIEKSIFKHPISINELKSFEMNESHVIWKIEKIKIIGFVCFFHVRDEIEIITDDKSLPPMAWEKIALTGKAKIAIRRINKEKIKNQYAEYLIKFKVPKMCIATWKRYSKIKKFLLLYF